MQEDLPHQIETKDSNKMKVRVESVKARMVAAVVRTPDRRNMNT